MLASDTSQASASSKKASFDYKKYLTVDRKSLYDRPLYLSKRQVKSILKGKIIRIHRGCSKYMDIGLKGFRDPVVVAKIEALEKQIKKLKSR